jgi:hypothetical protein
MTDVSGDDRFSYDENVITEEVDGEMLVMDLEGNEYFGLNEVSRVIWELVGAEYSVDDIVEAILEDFEVDAATARADIEAFLQDALGRGLLRRVEPGRQVDEDT